jgi:hypothetical protein
VKGVEYLEEDQYLPEQDVPHEEQVEENQSLGEEGEEKSGADQPDMDRKGWIFHPLDFVSNYSF